MIDELTLNGRLPDGPTFAVAVDRHVIAVAINGKVCCAYQRWMTPSEARSVAEALLLVAEHEERRAHE